MGNRTRAAGALVCTRGVGVGQLHREHLRGSGCSGGVFDVFNTAQQVDGYDVIEDGDATCAEHLEMREQNLDFEGFGRARVRRPRVTDSRDLKQLVEKIDVPVYLTGACQDEQTGPQFADMLGDFDNAPVTKFTMFNGRHPDGYSPPPKTRCSTSMLRVR